MAICISCGKHTISRSWSRHKKGSSGHGGSWNLKAQITKKLQSPNLHTFKGQKFCTKCLRLAKDHYKSANSTPVIAPKALVASAPKTATA